MIAVVVTVMVVAKLAIMVVTEFRNKNRMSFAANFHELLYKKFRGKTHGK
jgi:hypothetical protein